MTTITDVAKLIIDKLQLDKEYGDKLLQDIKSKGNENELVNSEQYDKIQKLLVLLDNYFINYEWLIGIVNTVGSLIATNVHCGTYLNIGREVAVPATKSFTS